MPSFSDANELQNLILEIIETQSVTPRQVFQIDQYYNLAKEMHSQGNISLAMEIMKAIAGIPVTMQGLIEYQLRAKGYVEALLFAVRSTVSIAHVKTEQIPARVIQFESVSSQKEEAGEANKDGVPVEIFSAPRRPPSFDEF